MIHRHALISVQCLLLLFLSGLLVYAQEQSGESRFIKLDQDGGVLGQTAEQWAMVKDTKTGLLWEVKTTDGSIHDRERTFGYESAKEEFIQVLNSTHFGGFSDWRLPTTDELLSIRAKGSEPYINQIFFPHTVPTSYLSWRKCGSGEIFSERVKFGKIRNSKKDRRVRAVRGKEAE